MSLAEALGASCNPAFARVALQHLQPKDLQNAATRFGFNASIPFEAELGKSTALIPESKYEFARTAAGFGEVFISPLHAATVMSAIANSGKLLQPKIVKSIHEKDGATLFESTTNELRSVTTGAVATDLLQMMESTTTTGTSRKEFLRSGKPVLGDIPVAGKTGTLRGQNPYGVNNWFIGAAPISNPDIAVAVVVVSPNGTSTRASRIARQIMQFYFNTYVSRPDSIETSSTLS
jgi:cell division protein FtsI/penicillin-binding protein 2